MSRSSISRRAGTRSPSRAAAALVAIAACLFLVLASSPVAAQQIHNCKPVEVLAWTTSVQIKCDNVVAGSSVNYFMAGTDQRFINRVIAVGTAAQVAQKRLMIVYLEGDMNGPGFGCQRNDCRVIHAVSVLDEPF